MFTQKSGGCQRLLGRHIATGSHHYIRCHTLIVARTSPDTNAFGTMNDSFINVRELQMLLLVSDNHIDAIGRSQALVGHSQQRIGIGR